MVYIYIYIYIFFKGSICGCVNKAWETNQREVDCKMCVCESVLLIWGNSKLVGWLLLGCGIKQACLSVGGGGRKGRGVLL